MLHLLQSLLFIVWFMPILWHMKHVVAFLSLEQVACLSYFRKTNGSFGSGSLWGSLQNFATSKEALWHRCIMSSHKVQFVFIPSNDLSTCYIFGHIFFFTHFQLFKSFSNKINFISLGKYKGKFNLSDQLQQGRKLVICANHGEMCLKV